MGWQAKDSHACVGRFAADALCQCGIHPRECGRRRLVLRAGDSEIRTSPRSRKGTLLMVVACCSRDPRSAHSIQSFDIGKLQRHKAKSFGWIAQTFARPKVHEPIGGRTRTCLDLATHKTVQKHIDR